MMKPASRSPLRRPRLQLPRSCNSGAHPWPARRAGGAARHERGAAPAHGDTPGRREGPSAHSQEPACRGAPASLPPCRAVPADHGWLQLSSAQPPALYCTPSVSRIRVRTALLLPREHLPAPLWRALPGPAGWRSRRGPPARRAALWILGRHRRAQPQQADSALENLLPPVDDQGAC